jgi:hypothetical protein
MTRLQHLNTTCGRWLMVGLLVFAMASATVIPAAAQSSGEGSTAQAMPADAAPVDADMVDTEQAQAGDAAPAAAPAVPKPTVAPYQFGPTGC